MGKEEEQSKKSGLKYVERDPYLRKLKKHFDENVSAEIDKSENEGEILIKYGLFTINRGNSYSLFTSEEAKGLGFDTFIRSYEGKTSWGKETMERINKIRREFNHPDLEIKND